MPSSNILLEYNTFLQGHGVTIGSEMSGNVTNIVFRESTCTGTATGARVKTMRGRGGVVEVRTNYTNHKNAHTACRTSSMRTFSSPVSARFDIT